MIWTPSLFFHTASLLSMKERVATFISKFFTGPYTQKWDLTLKPLGGVEPTPPMIFACYARIFSSIILKFSIAVRFVKRQFLAKRNLFLAKNLILAKNFWFCQKVFASYLIGGRSCSLCCPDFTQLAAFFPEIVYCSVSTHLAQFLDKRHHFSIRKFF
mgnify:CR=1 FL=1